MRAHHVTGFNALAPKADSRKASIHAGSTGLTGLTGVARAHTPVFSQSIQQQHSINKSPVRMKRTMLTLLTLFKASIHAGFNVTGFSVSPDMPRKGA
jgi:hypothetical protein